MHNLPLRDRECVPPAPWIGIPRTVHAGPNGVVCLRLGPARAGPGFAVAIDAAARRLSSARRLAAQPPGLPVAGQIAEHGQLG